QNNAKAAIKQPWVRRCFEAAFCPRHDFMPIA
ncbi:MAG: hypothetical protein RIS83_70, partial [Pseudomonadota bacterium]